MKKASFISCSKPPEFRLSLKAGGGGGCPYGANLKGDGSYTEKDLLPGGMCLLAFHAVYPYLTTLSGGGWFDWVAPGDGVVLQCPSPKDAVEMKVYPHGKDSARIVVQRSRGECPKGYSGGEEFILGPSTAKFCLKALDAFIPYIEVVAGGRKLPWVKADAPAELRCPHSGCGNAEFKLEVDG